MSSSTIQYGKITRESAPQDGGLTVFFSILCVIDLFGVFPVIALPKAVIDCGIYGIPMVIVVFAVQIYTSMLLGKSWMLAKCLQPEIQEKIRYPYAALAELTFGKYARKLVTFLLDSTIFGAGIPNLLVASQSLQLFGQKMYSVEVSYCIWLIVLGLCLCPVMWIGSPKDMKSLAITSVCIVTTVAACTFYCILTDDVSPPLTDFNLLDYKPDIKKFLVAYGIVAFQFDIHPMLLTLQVDMADSTKINSAIIGGFLVTGSMFLVTTVLAAMRYGFDTQPNILQGIPPSVPLYIVALLVTLQLCLSSAVGNSALFQNIEDLLCIPQDFNMRRCIARSAIIVFAVFLGETVPRFDIVMGLVGATLTGPLMFIFPPLFFLKLTRMESNLDQKHRKMTSYTTFAMEAKERPNNRLDVLVAVMVIIFGTLATLSATYFSWVEAINYTKFTPPCIFNASFDANLFN